MNVSTVYDVWLARLLKCPKLLEWCNMGIWHCTSRGLMKWTIGTSRSYRPHLTSTLFFVFCAICSRSSSRSSSNEREVRANLRRPRVLVSVNMTWDVNSNWGKAKAQALVRPRPTRRLRQPKLMPPRKRQPSRRSYRRKAQRLMKGKISFHSTSFIILNSGLACTDLAAPVLRLPAAGFRTLISLGGMRLRS